MNAEPREPRFSPAAMAARREHLMTEITPRPHTSTHTQPRTSARTSRLRRWGITAGIAALAVAGGGAVATATGHGIWRQDNGVVAIDVGALRPVYQGHYVTLGQVEDLNQHGKAMFSTNNRELACQGISLYFDTEAESNAYLADYDLRYPGTADTSSDTSSDTGAEDPCAPYADAPRYVTQD